MSRSKRGGYAEPSRPFRRLSPGSCGNYHDRSHLVSSRLLEAHPGGTVLRSRHLCHYQGI